VIYWEPLNMSRDEPPSIDVYADRILLATDLNHACELEWNVLVTMKMPRT
jgi:hypothetical protein